MSITTEHQQEALTEQYAVSLRTSPRTGRLQAVGVISAEAVTAEYVIPRRDSRHKSGYQRDVSTGRVNKLVGDMERGRVDLPTAVLLNLRDFDPGTHLVSENGQMYFRPNGAELFVVDGQHRIVALDKLVDRDAERWGTFPIPFVCMLGATEREEMEEFYVVNSTAKSVRTDLALDLLKQRAETDPEVMKGLIERGESWKVEAQAITEALAETEIWRNRIRFPGELKGVTTITSSGMVGSLKSLLSTPFFGAVSQENRLRILEAYWRGIKKVMPEVFDDPAEYTLQKATGVQVIHQVLITVIEHLRSEGKSVVDADAYAEVLREPLAELEGDTSTGDIAAGPEFWTAGPEGAAGSYSSNAGRRVLTAKLRSLLPAAEIE